MPNLVTAEYQLSEYRRDLRRTHYVCSVQGDGGKDWGWTDDPKLAMRASFYWARRFMADRRACGVKTAQAIELAPLPKG